MCKHKEFTEKYLIVPCVLCKGNVIRCWKQRSECIACHGKGVVKILDHSNPTSEYYNSFCMCGWICIMKKENQDMYRVIEDEMTMNMIDLVTYKVESLESIKRRKNK